MATTTPNFGWPVPTSTDLVKDGAVAIEALGDAVDASLLDLKGGTTGQVLAKATNTDMDFAWVAADDTNAIQNAIVDAKGDLIAASAADTPARLAVGANGETLVADSSTATGLRYTAGTVQGNPVLNSSFQVFQRGTSIAVNASTQPYTADRWQIRVGVNAASTVSRQPVSDTTNLPNIQYAARIQRNSGQTGTSAIEFYQNFETINATPFAGKTVTVSFYARSGANFSAASSQLFSALYSGTGTDQNIFTTYTGVATVINSIKTLTTTWQRFTTTATIANTATEFALGFSFTPTGTAGVNDYYEITGVQIDVGSVALPFRTYAGTIQGELAACQRYYYRANSSDLYAHIGQGVAYATTTAYIQVKTPVSLRVIPSSIEYSTIALYDGVNIIAATNAVLTSAQLSFNSPLVTITVASGLTQFRPYLLFGNNSSAAYLGLSAEL